jgi:hypothetical protein
MLRVLLRAAPWRGGLALSATAAALGAVAVLEGASGVGLKLVQITAVLVAGAAACALDEAAAAVVRACPVSRGRQLLVRAATAAVPLVVGLAVVVAWWQRAVVTHVLLLELVGCWVLGFALATVARARLDEPAELVASSLVLALLSVLLFDQIGRRLALFTIGEELDRTVHTWWAVMAVSGAALLLAVRERRWR